MKTTLLRPDSSLDSGPKYFGVNLIIKFHINAHCIAGFRIRIRIHMFLGLPDPDPDPLVRGMDPDPDPDPALDPDPSIIMQK